MVQSFERRKMQKAGVYTFGGCERSSSLWMPFNGLLGIFFCFVIGSLRHENTVCQSGTGSISSRGFRCHSWNRHLVLSRLGQPLSIQSAHHVPLYHYCSLRWALITFRLSLCFSKLSDFVVFSRQSKFEKHTKLSTANSVINSLYRFRTDTNQQQTFQRARSLKTRDSKTCLFDLIIANAKQHNHSPPSCAITIIRQLIVNTLHYSAEKAIHLSK
ncbi:hypothetical protein BKA61DRAFT_232456 [Leptodontidium sp. MPI-SDFR-AT-0119]|nr:hypothetical protein BKA61DRAFT_232456 [Leptodontidium sp. MPI-SDFR-AT-0119]